LCLEQPSVGPEPNQWRTRLRPPPESRWDFPSQCNTGAACGHQCQLVVLEADIRAKPEPAYMRARWLKVRRSRQGKVALFIPPKNTHRSILYHCVVLPSDLISAHILLRKSTEEVLDHPSGTQCVIPSLTAESLCSKRFLGHGFHAGL